MFYNGALTHFGCTSVPYLIAAHGRFVLLFTLRPAKSKLRALQVVYKFPVNEFDPKIARFPLAVRRLEAATLLCPANLGQC